MTDTYRVLGVLGLALTILSLAPAASAQTDAIVSSGPESIAITIYPDDLAMITEVRKIELPAGRSTIALHGVNDRIVPNTALLTQFGAVTIERNFDFDLLSKSTLFANSVGDEVTLFRTSPGSGEIKVERATIVSGANGTIFRIGDRFETFQCSGVSERVQFDRQPPRLQTDPTLSLTVDAKTPGLQTIEFRYLASGFRWKADYILTVDAKSTGSMTGWLTATNDTQVTLRDADLSIVAGEVSRLPDTQAGAASAQEFAALCMPAERKSSDVPGRAGIFAGRRLETVTVTGSRLRDATVTDRQDLSDYKLYRAPFRTTLAARQTKQILFLNKEKVEFKRRFVFEFAEREVWQLSKSTSENAFVHAVERYEIDNSKRGRMAEPLPRGMVRIMRRRANGSAFFIGASTINNLSVGMDAEVDTGPTDDVVLFPQFSNALSARNVDGGTTITHDATFSVSNAGDDFAEIEIAIRPSPEEKISNASLEAETRKSEITWRFKLPAGGTRPLSFTYLAGD